MDLCDFGTIVALLDEAEPTVLNAVQLIGNLAENPKGQKLAEKYLAKIDALNNIERIYIDATLDIIKWKP